MKSIIKVNQFKAIYQSLLTGLLMLAFFIPGHLQSQCYDHKVKPIQFNKGDLTYNIGIGLMPSFRGKNLKTPVPPISMMFNYRPIRNATIGFYMGYSLTEAVMTKKDSNREALEEKKVSNNFYILGIRAEGHCVRGRADFYGGAMLAYNFSDIDSNLKETEGYETNIRVEDYADLITWSGHVGFKYLISKHIGVFSEIGYGVSLFTFGTTFKF